MKIITTTYLFEIISFFIDTVHTIIFHQRKNQLYICSDSANSIFLNTYSNYSFFIELKRVCFKFTQIHTSQIGYHFSSYVRNLRILKSSVSFSTQSGISKLHIPRIKTLEMGYPVTKFERKHKKLLS